MPSYPISDSLATIDAIEDDDAAAMQTLCLGLLHACPLGGNPPDCQAHHIRLLPLDERMAWLRARSGPELKAMFKRHIQFQHDRQ
jgi:hypothetical protein